MRKMTFSSAGYGCKFKMMPMRKIFFLCLAAVMLTGPGMEAAWYWPFGSKEKSTFEPAKGAAQGRKFQPVTQRSADKIYPKAPLENEGVSVKKIKELAEAGNANAQLTLGKIYFDGLVGEKQNFSKALKYFNQAAGNGSPEAMYNIGICYDGGFGMRRPDLKQALAWYRKAADAGVPEAQLKTAVWAEAHGEAETAFKYYKLLADAGDQACMNQVALFMLNGFGTPADPEGAVKYLVTGAEEGNVRAMIRLADCYQQGLGVPQDYREMAKWLELAAVDGDPEAQAKLGRCYQDGMGVVANNENAFKWYRISAEGKYAVGQYLLGNCYRDGIGTSVNLALAAENYRAAADQGDGYAQMELGEAYRKGDGVPVDMDEAARWLREAADKGGIAIANARLALALAESGRTGEAQERLEKALASPDPLARIQAALWLIRGAGKIHDSERGMKVLKDMAEAGNVEAREVLGVM